VGGAAWGCNLLVDSSAYHEVALVGEAGTDAKNLGGNGCDAGTNRTSLEMACTESQCVPFPLQVPSCDGGLCPLPGPSDAGAAPSGDGGSAMAAADGGPPSCKSIGSDPSAIVYVTGSTALASFVNEVSSALASQVTIVYQQSGSCVGVRSAIDPDNNILSSANGTATYYTSTGAQQTCTLDPNDMLTADIGASDVFYTTCYLGQPATPTFPPTVTENFGPVQVMNFAVPSSSTEKSISLTAAYYVFGFGGTTYPVAPWTDPSQLQIRSANSGTQSLIGAAIGVPPAQWIGVGHSTSAAVGAALVAAGQNTDPNVVNSALGILASDYLNQNTQSLRGLAVQDENVSCSYYPNSTLTARDNINARDGHYPLWGPSHFYARVDAMSKLPQKPGISKFIDGLNGVTAVPGLDLIAEYAAKGLVPQCAMHVTRANDGGDYTPFTAPVTCNCYFDWRASGVNTCQACTTSSDCPAAAPNCNKFGPAPQQGYCDL
jgi:hypothetical protein